MPCYAVARQGLVWKRRQQKKGSMDGNGAIGEAVLPRQATMLCPLRGGGEGVCVCPVFVDASEASLHLRIGTQAAVY